MVTNELKKGMRVRLRNTWEGDVADNAKGNTRMVKVYGFETEIGSVYSHDIEAVFVHADGSPMMNVAGDSAQSHAGLIGATGEWVDVEHTPAQLKFQKQIRAFGF